MGMYFALRYMAVLRLKDVLNRILQRNDVLVALDVDLLHQCSQRRRFPASYRSSDEDEAVMISSQQFQVLGQTEFVHGANMAVDYSKNDIRAQTLAHYTGTVRSEERRVGKESGARWERV